MRWGIVVAEIIHGLCEAVAEEVPPEPIHHRPRQKRTGHHHLGKLLPTIDAVGCSVAHRARQIPALGDLGTIKKNRIGDLGQAVAEFVVDLGFIGVAPLAGKVLIDQFYRGHVVSAVKATEGGGLPKERVELPKLVLLAFVKGMVVTLGALDLHRQKHLGGSGCCLNAVVGHLAGEKVCGSVEVRASWSV